MRYDTSLNDLQLLIDTLQDDFLNIACIGCGTGSSILPIISVKSPLLKAYAIDFSATALEALAKHPLVENVNGSKGDSICTTMIHDIAQDDISSGNIHLLLCVNVPMLVVYVF